VREEAAISSGTHQTKAPMPVFIKSSQMSTSVMSYAGKIQKFTGIYHEIQIFTNRLHSIFFQWYQKQIQIFVCTMIQIFVTVVQIFNTMVLNSGTKVSQLQ
jgi:hypothetical protein